jgi:hypothetical protein
MQMQLWIANGLKESREKDSCEKGQLARDPDESTRWGMISQRGFPWDLKM